MSSPSSTHNDNLHKENTDNFEKESTDNLDKENTDNLDEENTDNLHKENTLQNAQWQAVYSPEYNAYYFYNPSTQQTTWTNPLVPDPSPSSTPTSTHPHQEPSNDQDEPEGEEASSSKQQPPMSSVAAQHAAIHAAAVAQGIDPLLARLDPSLVASATAGPGGSAVGGGSSLSSSLRALTNHPRSPPDVHSPVQRPHRPLHRCLPPFIILPTCSYPRLPI